MPLVDERVVELSFDGRKFEAGVRSAVDALDRLDNDTKKGLDSISSKMNGIEKAFSSVSMKGFSNAVSEGIKQIGFLEVAVLNAFNRISNAAIDAGMNLIRSFTRPARQGFAEYETQINAVQTIWSNTKNQGTSLDQVNEALDTLNTYADQTIYNFTQMTKNIGTFTAAGVSLDTSVKAIKGIANLAAVSGSNAEQASRAMYQLSQALSLGSLKLQDYNSLINAGMGGKIFQDALMETARVHGVAVDQIIAEEGSFRESLSRGWATTDILLETLEKFTRDLNEDQLRAIGYTDEQIASIVQLGKDAEDAATKVKTITQLKDTLGEAMQSGWTQTWEIIIGDMEEATTLLTSISQFFEHFITMMNDSRNNFLESIFGTPADRKVTRKELTELLRGDIHDSGAFTSRALRFRDQLVDAAREAGIEIDAMMERHGYKFEKTLEEGWLSADLVDKVIKSRKIEFDEWYSFTNKFFSAESGGDMEQLIAFQDRLIAQARESGIAIDDILAKYDGVFMASLQEGWLTQELLDTAIAGGTVSNSTIEGLQQVVDEVWMGAWGNGEERWAALAEAGWDPELVQSLVDMGYGQVDWDNLTVEQMQAIGLTEEQIAWLQNLETSWDEMDQRMTGRDTLVTALQTLLTTMTKLSDLAGAAWNAIFPPVDPSGVTGVFTSILEFTNGIAKFVDDHSAQIQNFFEGVFSIVALIGDIGGAAFSIITGIVEAFIGMFSGTDTAQAGDEFAQNLSDWADGIKKFREELLESGVIQGFVENVVTNVRSLFEIAGGAIQAVISFFKGEEIDLSFLEKAKEFIDKIRNAIRKISFKPIANIFKPIQEFLASHNIKFEWLDNLIETLSNLTLGDVFDNIKNSFNNLLTTLGITDENNPIAKIVSWFSGIEWPEDPFGTLWGYISTFWNDMLSFIGWVVNGTDAEGNVSGAPDPIGRVKEWLDTKIDGDSPFKDFLTWLTGFMDEVNKFVDWVVNGEEGDPRNPFERIRDWALETVSGFWPEDNPLDTIVGWFNTIRQKIAEFFNWLFGGGESGPETPEIKPRTVSLDHMLKYRLTPMVEIDKRAAAESMMENGDEVDEAVGEAADNAFYDSLPTMEEIHNWVLNSPIGWLVNEIETFLSTFDPLKTIQETFQKFGDWISGVAEQVGIKEAFDGVKKFIDDAEGNPFVALVNWFEQELVPDSMKTEDGAIDLLKPIKDWFSGLGTWFDELYQDSEFSKFVEDVKAFTSGTVGTVTKFIDEAQGNPFVALINFVTTLVPDNLKGEDGAIDLLKPIKDWFSGLGTWFDELYQDSGLQDFAEGVKKFTSETWSNVTGAIDEAGGNPFLALVNFIVDLVPDDFKGEDGAIDLLKPIKDWFSGLGTWFDELYHDVGLYDFAEGVKKFTSETWGGIAGGIDEAGGNPFLALVNFIVDLVPDNLKGNDGAIDLLKPIKDWFDGLGTWFDELYRDSGLQDFAEGVKKFTSETWGGITGAIDEAGGNPFLALVNFIVDLVPDNLKDDKGAIDLLKPIKDWFSGLSTWFDELYKDSGLQDFAEGVEKFTSETWSNIIGGIDEAEGNPFLALVNFIVDLVPDNLKGEDGAIDLLKPIKDWFSGLGTWFDELYQDSGLQEFAEGVEKFTSETWSNVVGAIDEAGGNPFLALYNWFIGIIPDAFKTEDGAIDLLKPVKDWFSGLGTWFDELSLGDDDRTIADHIEDFKKAVGLDGFFTWFEELGQNLSSNPLETIAGWFTDFQTWIQTVGSWIANIDIDKDNYTLGDRVEDIINSTPIPEFINWVSTLVPEDLKEDPIGAITKWFDDFSSWIRNFKLTEDGPTLEEAVTDFIDNVGPAFEKFFGWIRDLITGEATIDDLKEVFASEGGIGSVIAGVIDGAQQMIAFFTQPVEGSEDTGFVAWLKSIGASLPEINMETIIEFLKQVGIVIGIIAGGAFILELGKLIVQFKQMATEWTAPTLGQTIAGKMATIGAALAEVAGALWLVVDSVSKFVELNKSGNDVALALGETGVVAVILGALTVLGTKINEAWNAGALKDKGDLVSALKSINFSAGTALYAIALDIAADAVGRVATVLAACTENGVPIGEVEGTFAKISAIFTAFKTMSGDIKLAKSEGAFDDGGKALGFETKNGWEQGLGTLLYAVSLEVVVDALGRLAKIHEDHPDLGTPLNTLKQLGDLISEIAFFSGGFSLRTGSGKAFGAPGASWSSGTGDVLYVIALDGCVELLAKIENLGYTDAQIEHATGVLKSLGLLITELSGLTSLATEAGAGIGQAIGGFAGRLFGKISPSKALSVANTASKTGDKVSDFFSSMSSAVAGGGSFYLLSSGLDLLAGAIVKLSDVDDTKIESVMNTLHENLLKLTGEVFLANLASFNKKFGDFAKLLAGLAIASAATKLALSTSATAITNLVALYAEEHGIDEALEKAPEISDIIADSIGVDSEALGGSGEKIGEAIGGGIISGILGVLQSIFDLIFGTVTTLITWLVAGLTGKSETWVNAVLASVDAEKESALASLTQGGNSPEALAAGDKARAAKEWVNIVTALEEGRAVDPAVIWGWYEAALNDPEAYGMVDISYLSKYVGFDPNKETVIKGYTQTIVDEQGIEHKETRYTYTDQRGNVYEGLTEEEMYHHYYLDHQLTGFNPRYEHTAEEEPKFEVDSETKELKIAGAVYTLSKDSGKITYIDPRNGQKWTFDSYEQFGNFITQNYFTDDFMWGYYKDADGIPTVDLSNIDEDLLSMHIQVGDREMRLDNFIWEVAAGTMQIRMPDGSMHTVTFEDLNSGGWTELLNNHILTAGFETFSASYDTNGVVTVTSSIDFGVQTSPRYSLNGQPPMSASEFMDYLSNNPDMLFNLNGETISGQGLIDRINEAAEEEYLRLEENSQFGVAILPEADVIFETALNQVMKVYVTPVYEYEVTDGSVKIEGATSNGEAVDIFQVDASTVEGMPDNVELAVDVEGHYYFREIGSPLVDWTSLDAALEEASGAFDDGNASLNLAVSIGSALGKSFGDPSLMTAAQAGGVDVFDNFVNGGLGALQARASDVTAAGGSVGQEVYDGAYNALEEGSPSKKMYRVGVWAIEGLVNGVQSRAGRVMSALRSVVFDALSAIQLDFAVLNEIGGNIALGLAGGIREKSFEVIDATVQMTTNSINAARESLGVQSPSKEFEAIGEYSALGYAGGLRRRVGEVEQASKYMGDVATSSLREAILMASKGNLEVTPRITPVLDAADSFDLSGVYRSFGNYSADMLSTIAVDREGATTIYNNAYDDQGVIAAIYALNARIDQLDYDISNMSMVMDTGALVGQLAPGIDKKMGASARRKARGV